MNRALPPGDRGYRSPDPRRESGSGRVVLGLGGLVGGIAAAARFGRYCATVGPRSRRWRRLGVRAKAAVTGAGRAGIEARSKKVRRGRSRAAVPAQMGAVSAVRRACV
jgi:hypothetical protein